jgi:hypothetical protein
MRSNQRPDTLMQDRSPPARPNPLATHGRTIHMGATCEVAARFTYVRYGADSGRIDGSPKTLRVPRALLALAHPAPTFLSTRAGWASNRRYRIGRGTAGGCERAGLETAVRLRAE